ncbi:GON domain-containing protein [Archangium lansingense]|uniref:GON domain-containing protein n=1 Tax=Archangium lansingense TaxID=2995310 RepID=A0ABT4AIE4_9BACT|nr:GON domain-containing protein [Archangium lansinium]MCY1080679.1 GON domain-containing protein [Archangium lansinium]
MNSNRLNPTGMNPSFAIAFRRWLSPLSKLGMLTALMTTTASHATSPVLDQANEPYSLYSVQLYTGAVPGGQTFTVGKTGKLSQVSVYVQKQCLPGCPDMLVQLRSTSGQVLASSTVSQASIPTGSYNWIDAGFSQPISVLPGEQYAIVLQNAQPHVSGGYDWKYETNSSVDSYPGGLLFQVGYNSHPAYDLYFRTYVNEVHNCAEVRAQNSAAPDGTYPLTLGGKQVEVYCHDMAGTPREYLTVKTGSTTNYSYYGQGPNTSAGGQTTWYSKVRLDPAALTLVLDDTTFSTSQGWMNFGSNFLYTSPLGSAGDCVTAYSQTGRSNIDLTGTPFDIVPGQFVTEGWVPAGSVANSGSQIVNLTGGGYCGATFDPDYRLQLTLQ